MSVHITHVPNVMKELDTQPREATVVCCKGLGQQEIVKLLETQESCYPDVLHVLNSILL